MLISILNFVQRPEPRAYRWGNQPFTPMNGKAMGKSKFQSTKSLKEIKKELDLKDTYIAEIFEYKNVLSSRNSYAKDRIDRAIERYYALISC